MNKPKPDPQTASMLFNTARSRGLIDETLQVSLLFEDDWTEEELEDLMARPELSEKTRAMAKRKLAESKTSNGAPPEATP